MTLQQLEYVLAVERFRHFSKAAEYCRVTQPTLSAMIQKLEEELDIKIFDRASQPVRPTQIGMLVVRRAQEILAQAESLRQMILEEKHSLSGTFKLGVLPTIAPYLLPRFFSGLMKKCPELDIRVMEMKTNEIKTSLRNGGIDAGVVADLSDMDDFSRNTLFYELYYAYVSRESRLFGQEVVRTSELDKEELWLLDEGHCFRDQLVKFCRMKSAQVSQQVYRLGSMETFMRMVENGTGITFIPELAVYQLDGLQKELVRPFAVPSPARKVVLLTRKDYVRSTLVKTIVREIRASVPKDMLALKPTQTLV